MDAGTGMLIARETEAARSVAAGACRESVLFVKTDWVGNLLGV